MKKPVLLFFGLIFLLKGHNISYSGETAEKYNILNDRGSPYMNISRLKPNIIIHIPTGIQIDKRQLIENISASRIVYIGETHDNLESHKIELEIIEALESAFPGSIAVGMEMFRSPYQKDINSWMDGDLNEEKFFKLWTKNWGNDYESYKPILDFIKEKKIPLIALKPDKELEKKIHKKGLAGLSEEDQKLLPEIDENDSLHKKYAMTIFGGHDSKKHTLVNPYNILLLWEETMADNIAKFLKSEKGRDKKMIVLAGGFHIEYGFGIPKRTFRRLPQPYTTILPTATYVPSHHKDKLMNVDPDPVPLFIGDYVWSVEYKTLSDTKVRLGINLKEDETGLSVISVVDNSNAKRTGILKGDIILAMDNKQVKSVGELLLVLQEKNIGDTGLIKLVRSDHILELEVVFQKTEDYHKKD